MSKYEECSLLKMPLLCTQMFKVRMHLFVYTSLNNAKSTQNTSHVLMKPSQIVNTMTWDCPHQSQSRSLAALA